MFYHLNLFQRLYLITYLSFMESCSDDVTKFIHFCREIKIRNHPHPISYFGETVYPISPMWVLLVIFYDFTVLARIISKLTYTYKPHISISARDWDLAKHQDKAFPFFCSSVQFSSVTQSCPTLCNPMDGSMPGFPVHRQLPELAQTHVHQVHDAIQPYHPLSSPSPPAFNLSQHQGLFK